MALHRDIYWIGRQWAVTGFGVQAVDQRLKGTFDVEVAHLWDDDLPQRMRALAWLKADDFDKALDIARVRFPEPPRKNLPLVESILEMIPPGGRSEALKSPAVPIEASPPGSEPPTPPLARNEARAPTGDAPKPWSIGDRPRSAPSKPAIEATRPAADPPKATPAPIEPSPPPAAPPKPPVAPVEARAPASRPPTRTVMGSKPAPPPAAPPKPVVAPADNSVPPSKPKPLVAAPTEVSVRASKPDEIEPPPAKFQPLALRIEHASAKFLQRWRVRR